MKCLFSGALYIIHDNVKTRAVPFIAFKKSQVFLEKVSQCQSRNDHSEGMRNLASKSSFRKFLKLFSRRQDIQHNDIRHNDARHDNPNSINSLNGGSQHKDS
jgi:hypothetical protein